MKQKERNEMIPCICVGLGGFAGASLRYLCGMIPFAGSFPLITLLINLAGSFCIGLIAALSGQFLSPNLTLFLKTGFCGGFTTFSTFSLETVQLIGKGKAPAAVLYAVLSVCLCLLGVYLGSTLGNGLLRRGG